MDTLSSHCLFLLLRRDRDTYDPSPVASPSSQESGSNRQHQFSANWASGNCPSFQIYCRTAVKTCDPLSTLSLLAGRAGVKRRLGSPWKPDAHIHVSGINQSSGLLFPHAPTVTILSKPPGWTRLRHIQTGSVNFCYRTITGRPGEITQIKYLKGDGGNQIRAATNVVNSQNEQISEEIYTAEVMLTH